MPNYTLGDGETVKNRLGATSHEALEKAETSFVVGRQLQHVLSPQFPRTFDRAHLTAIHRHLFQDVYEWAGHTRDEPVQLLDGSVATEPLIRKPGGKPFVIGTSISTGLDDLAERLRKENYLQGLSRSDFATRAASVLGEINGIHAFREGNGRTQRIFMQELAESAGHSLEFRVVTKERMIQASIAAHEQGDIGLLRRMMDEISNPHRVAALTPAIAFLNSAKFPWNENYLATMEPGRAEDVTLVGVNGAHFMARTENTILVGQRKDLPSADTVSGARIKVFTSPWPDSDNAASTAARPGPSPGP
ncbi:MAG: Fic family protein [Rhodospirillales bacterium]|nr:Fic family protein [Rhodospirillales bacterium]